MVKERVVDLDEVYAAFVEGALQLYEFRERTQWRTAEAKRLGTLIRSADTTQPSPRNPSVDETTPMGMTSNAVASPSADEIEGASIG